MFLALLLTATALTMPPAAHAQTEWTGAAGDDWFDPANWTAGVPTATTSTHINGDGTAPAVAGSNAVSGPLFLGQGGNPTGSLVIANGGVLESAQAGIGWDPGTDYVVTVSGSTSSWQSIGQFSGISVGHDGRGELNILDGADVVSLESPLGYAASAEGYVLVDGAGSTWTVTKFINEALTVGVSGHGELTISGGGVVTSEAGKIAGGGTGTGTVTVTGAGSQWDTTTSLEVGGAGQGQLSILDGGSVVGEFSHIGVNASGEGRVLVDGVGSTWNLTGSQNGLQVGYGGHGELVVSNGGVVTTEYGGIGLEATSTGTAIVTGDGSQWNTNLLLRVGHSGDGQLSVLDGGKVEAENLSIGSNGGSGSMLVSGANSSVNVSQVLRVGTFGSVADEASGVLTIAEGGTVTVSDAMHVGSLHAPGILNIGAALGDPAVAPGTLDVATVNLGAPGILGEINFNHTGAAYEFSAEVKGNEDSIIESRSGTTILTEDGLAFLGHVRVSGGTLLVNEDLGPSPAQNILQPIPVQVYDAGTLGGTGEIHGDVQVDDGTVAPGASVGVLRLGSLALSDLSTLDFELGDPAGTPGVDSDLLEVDGDLDLDGTLNVTDAGGFGDGTYRLIDYGGTLTDNGLDIGAVPAGYTASELAVLTTTQGQIDLLVGASSAVFWDGSNTVPNGVVDGGGGTWTATATNWTDASGSANAVYDPSAFLIFQGAGGAVLVDDSNGAVALDNGMQFAVDGYSIDGDDITLSGAATVRVGDGTVAGEGYVADIGNSLVGSGSLKKTDLGVLTLSGSNSYTGGTELQAGTIALGSNTTPLGSGQITVTGSSRLADIGGGVGNIDVTNDIVIDPGATLTAQVGLDQPGSLTLSGSISGDGALDITRFAGPTVGSLNLLGANTYTGGTTVNDALVTIGDSDAFGTGAITINGPISAIGNGASASVDIANDIVLNAGSRLVFAATGNSTENTITGDVSGAGSFAKGFETKTLILAGNNTYSGTTLVPEGTLAAGSSTAFSAASAFTLEDGGTLDLNGFDETIGSLAGEAGSFVTNGGSAPATLTAGGDDSSTTYAGTIEDSASPLAFAKTGTGTLLLTGTSTYTGPTDILAGTLLVDGTIGGAATVRDGATLGGNGTAGTATVTSGGTLAPGSSIGTLNVASATFDAGSIYQVELNDGGTAAGTNNDLLLASGAVTINGGEVQVRPENATDDGTTYVGGSQYTIITAAGGVTGTLTSLADDYAFLDFELAYDANNVYLTSQLTAATGFCLPDMTANQCATGDGVFSLGSGNLYTAVLNLPDDEAFAALDALSGEINASAKSALIEDSRFPREAALDRLRVALGAVAADRNGMIEKRMNEDFAFWTQAFGAWGEWEGDGNAAGFDRTIGGFFLGGDARVGDNLHVGVFGGYGSSSFDVDDRDSTGFADTWHLGAYGGTTIGDLGLRLGAAYAWHDVETSRSVAFTGFSDSLADSYEARTGQIFGEAGYHFDRGAMRFEPFANLAYVHLETDGHAETGGPAALSVESDSMGTAFTTIGLRAATEVGLGEIDARFFAMAGWRHAFGDVTPISTHAFADGEDFTIAGVPVAEDALVLDAGVAVNLTPDATLELSYDGQFGSDFADQGLKANLAVRF